MTKKEIINTVNKKTLLKLNKKVIKEIIKTKHNKIRVYYYEKETENYSSLSEAINHFNKVYLLKLFKKDNIIIKDYKEERTTVIK